MKLTALALSAFGLAILTAAQNGNDPLILNNRTGLDPVVYDTFSTSYTNAPIVTSVVSATLTASRFNTSLPKPTTSIQCWRNGYPCGQNGGERSLRLVADHVVPTAALAARVPPPEWFSTRPDVPLPGASESPSETGELIFDILPIPTSLIGEALAHSSGGASMGILPIPASLDGKPRTYDAPPSASSTTSEAVFSILPITMSTHAAETTTIPQPLQSKWPEDWWRGPTSPSDGLSISTISEEASFPTSRDCNLHFCPTGTPSTSSTPPSTPLPTIPGPIGNPSITPFSTNSHFAIPPPPGESVIRTHTTSSTSAYESYTVTIDCTRHYCASGMQTVYTITPTPYTFTNLPSPTSGFAVPPAPTHGSEAGVPIEWWRGPGQPILPDTPGSLKGPIQRHSTIESVSIATNDPCFRHYCHGDSRPSVPSWTTTQTTFGPVKSATLHFPDAPPSVTSTARGGVSLS